MHLVIKRSQGTVIELDIAEDATVAALKEAIQEKDPQCAAGTVRLIYTGKILVDTNTLASYGVKDGHSIHMVVVQNRTAARPVSSPPQPTPLPTPPPPTPPPTAPMGAPMGAPTGGFPGFGMPGMDMFGGAGGFDFAQFMNSPMVRQMMQQMMENPQMFADMMRMNPMFANNPMMQQLASNPEALRAQMQLAMQMMGGGAGGAGAPGAPAGGMPDLGAIMSSPEARQMMQQMASNPQMLSDMMRMNPMFASNPMMQEMANNPELLQQQMEMARQLFGGGAAAPAPAAPQVDREFLRRLLGNEPSEANITAITSNQQMMDGLRQIAAGAQALRRGGVLVFNDIVNIDTILGQLAVGARPAPAAPVAPPAAPAPAPTYQMTPEQRFGPQLAQMHDCGFLDDQRNIEALIATNGNVNAAVDWILSH